MKAKLKRLFDKILILIGLKDKKKKTKPPELWKNDSDF